MPIITRDATISDVLDRLSDSDEKVWTRDEIGLYADDAYAEFTRRTKCLYDHWVIENVLPSANWQTDLELYHIQQRPGWGYTDGPFHYTDDERNLGVGGRVGGSYAGPSAITNPGQTALAAALDSTMETPATCPGGYLPDTTVEVQRVTYDQKTITGLTSAQAQLIEPNYETESGDPRYFTFDKDGINYLRLIPVATCTASYDTVSGAWGTRTYTSDTATTAVTTEANGYNTGGYGILRYQTGCFPALGPWGSPTRIHPDGSNTRVELVRIGQNFSSHPSELPSAYHKYVVFFAMSKALRRDGPGQDLDLAQHYSERFEMGVLRLTRRVNQLAIEYHGRFRPPASTDTFTGGWPQPPSAYGVVGS